jgi:hypothetical protein
MEIAQFVKDKPGLVDLAEYLGLDPESAALPQMRDSTTRIYALDHHGRGLWRIVEGDATGLDGRRHHALEFRPWDSVAGVSLVAPAASRRARLRGEAGAGLTGLEATVDFKSGESVTLTGEAAALCIDRDDDYREAAILFFRLAADAVSARIPLTVT